MSQKLKDTIVACPNCDFSIDFEYLEFEDGEGIWEDGFENYDEMEGIAICPNCGAHFKLKAYREWYPHYSIEEGEIVEATE